MRAKPGIKWVPELVLRDAVRLESMVCSECDFYSERDELPGS